MLADAGPGKVTPSLTRTVTSTHTRTAPRKSHRSIRGVMPAQHTRTTQGRVRPSRVRHAARLDAPRQVPAPSPQRCGEGGEGEGEGEGGGGAHMRPATTCSSLDTRVLDIDITCRDFFAMTTTTFRHSRSLKKVILSKTYGENKY